MKLITRGGRLIGWKDADGVHYIGTLAEAPKIKQAPDGKYIISGGNPEILDMLTKGMSDPIPEIVAPKKVVSNASKDKKNSYRV